MKKVFASEHCNNFFFSNQKKQCIEENELPASKKKAKRNGVV